MVYTFMGTELYTLSLSNLPDSAEWVALSSTQGPKNNLLYYGIEVTASKKLVIFGGVTESIGTATMRYRKFTSYSSLWQYDLSSPTPDFSLINWASNGGGYSKILRLEGELLCILNPSMPNQMVAINMEKMVSYSLKVFAPIENMQRTGFGIVAINGTDFIIIGGYNEHSGSQEISPYYMIYQLSFQNTGAENSLETVVFSDSIIGVLVAMIILLVIIGFFFKKRFASLQNERLVVQELEQFDKAVEENIKNRMLNIYNDPEFTATLNLPNEHVLSVPGYRKAEMGKDFREEQKIAQGGFGTVSTGKILKIELLGNNTAISDCVVKRNHKAVPEPLFFQELSIHEVFNDLLFRKSSGNSFEVLPQRLIKELYIFTKESKRFESQI
jgi:hypothetical protein